ncbi:MAG: hypothetical protein IPO91_15560 [Chloroflexi bacterium]|nr:hypothetical protein [Chloroflexota bacterium]
MLTVGISPAQQFGDLVIVGAPCLGQRDLFGIGVRFAADAGVCFVGDPAPVGGGREFLAVKRDVGRKRGVVDLPHNRAEFDPLRVGQADLRGGVMLDVRVEDQTEMLNRRDQ